MALPLSLPIVFAFAVVIVVIVVCVFQLQSQWQQARGMMSWSWAKDPELQSRWLDFATPLLPWPLRRACLVTNLWSSAAFVALAALIAAISTSAEGLFVAGWCFIIAIAAATSAVRIGRSRHHHTSSD